SVTVFRPITPNTSSATNIIMPILNTPPKTIISTSTVPTAPIPTKTAYTVLAGIFVDTYTSSPKLTTTAITVNPHSNHVSAYFKPVAQPISNIAAIMTNNHI